jgi:hypothetical protein
VVKSLRASSLTRLTVVAVMLLSWLVITNHCALGQMMRATAAHAHCHAAKNDDGKRAPSDGVRECCRAIKASLAGQKECGFDASQFQLHVYAIVGLMSASAVKPAPSIFLDHGPPRAESFAEIVLQRSLPSHAPPVLA